MGGFSKSDSESTQQATNRSFVFPEQVQPLQNLYGRATSVANSQSGIGNEARRASGPLISGGNQFLDSLLNVTGSGNNQDITSSLINNPFDFEGSDFFANLQNLANPIADPFLQDQIDLLGEDIATQVNRILPGVDSEFIDSGTAGGSRNQIERALTNEAGLREFSRGASSLRSDALSRALDANRAGIGAELSAADLNRSTALSAGDLSNRSGATTIAAAQTGLNSLDNLLALNLAPYGAQFSPLLNLATILGNPTVLSEGQSTGQSESSSFGFNALLRGP